MRKDSTDTGKMKFKTPGTHPGEDAGYTTEHADWNSEEMSEAQRPACVPAGGKSPGEDVKGRGGLTPIPEGPRHVEAGQMRSQRRYKQDFKKRPVICCLWWQEIGP